MRSQRLIKVYAFVACCLFCPCVALAVVDATQDQGLTFSGRMRDIEAATFRPVKTDSAQQEQTRLVERYYKLKKLDAAHYQQWQAGDQSDESIDALLALQAEALMQESGTLSQIKEWRYFRISAMITLVIVLLVFWVWQNHRETDGRVVKKGGMI